MAARVWSLVIFGQSELGAYYIKYIIRNLGLIFEYRKIRMCIRLYIAIEHP